ncbi:MAG: PaaX family transcriptional regulator, partial [Rhizobium sp.]
MRSRAGLSADNVKPGHDLNEAVRALLVDLPIKAASFIVTIYGDVVEPRGGVVWIGNLIEACKCVGITETLVRTAVSRLVTAGQLVGEREGRRSYYRL